MNPHRRLFSHYPLVQLASAFAAGICAAHWLSIRPVLLVSAAAGCSVLAFLFLKRLRLAGFFLLVGFCLAGVVLAGLQKNHESGLRRFVKSNENKPVTLIGWLDGPPEFARDRVYLSLRVYDPVHGRVWLLATSRNSDAYRALQLRYGAQIRVTTTLEITGNYHNPGVASLKEFLDRSGYDASGIIKNPAAIFRLQDKQVFPPLAALYDWRERLQREIDTRFSSDTAGVLDAALLGNRYNLSPDASERFREGGTFHVLVISGLHITFIGGLIFLLVRRLTERRLPRFLLPAAIVWAYSIAVGADASVVRAALMFTFAGAGLVIFRQATSFNALGGAALLLLAYSPKLIFDPSFQLTFLSVLAIVVLAWPLLLKLESIGAWYPTRVNPHPPVCSRALRTFCELLFWREQRWQHELKRSSHHYRLFKAPPALWLERYHLQWCLRYAFGAVVVSASVQVVLLPLMIIYFHRLSLSSLVLNIIVSVLLAALVAVALLALLAAQLNATLAEPLFRLADAVNWLMVHSVDPFSNSGFSGFRLAEYSGHGVILYGIYYLPLLFLIIALVRWQPLALLRTNQRHTVKLSFAQLILAAVLVFHPLSRDRADGKLRIDFLDVGQGDSALLTMPDGTTL
jgi:competence protein ComEC